MHGLFNSRHHPLSDYNNIRHLLQDVIVYEQDLGTVPPTNDYQSFEAALASYAPDSSVFVSPNNGLPYTLNVGVSGLPLTSITDPATTELLRDSSLNQDGSLNIAYVDGGIVTQEYFVPQALNVGPDNETHLLWPKAINQNRYGPFFPGQAALWTLTPSGTTLTENTETIAYNDKVIAFSVGDDDGTRLLESTSFLTVYPNPPITGAITLDTIATDGSLEGTLHYGPYDGWTPLFLATGPDNTSRLLWQRYDGQFALWNVSPAGDYLGDVRLQPLFGTTPAGMARGPDERTRLLEKSTTTGVATLVTLSPQDRVEHMVKFQPHPGFAVTALAIGADNRPRLLWDNGQGQAEVWTLTSEAKRIQVVTFALAPGYTASQLAVGQAGDLHILWTASDGSGRLQALHPNGTVISVRDLTPYQ